ncbi:MAG TPA: hypothetical protein VHM92_07270 [Allosphingosinicella sp.]|nr:hypothetical protein [Allosphingosinicella sp.]
MADYLYTSDGSPQGFRLGAFIYAMDGTPVGRVFAEKAYRLDGSYAGAVINNMIVDRPGVSRRSLPAYSAPEPAVPPANRETRRPVGESFPDCFDRLIVGEAAEAA